MPVLLTETIAALQPRPGGRYLDGTFGGGGHTRALLEASAPDGRVLAIDADPEAIARGELIREASGVGDRLILVHGNFADLGSIARTHHMIPLDGVLLDLGFSSFQIDDPERGFAFRLSGPLDMRFDPTRGRPAVELVNELPEDALADLLRRYGEEPRAKRIAAAIVRERATSPIETTEHLAQIVAAALGGRRGAQRSEVAQTFQALRIAVNDELGALERALDGAVGSLGPGGRLAVISFHSLEDRLVKEFIRTESRTCLCPEGQPICTCGHRPRMRRVGSQQRASADEAGRNPRSRSAILRVAERLADNA